MTMKTSLFAIIMTKTNITSNNDDADDNNTSNYNCIARITSINEEDNDNDMEARALTPIMMTITSTISV